MGTDAIPTDRAMVVTELARLLEETPLTTDRGRMFHLLNALASPEPATGGGGSAASALKIATANYDATNVSPNGVVGNNAFAFDSTSAFAIGGGNFLTISLNNSEGTLDSDLNLYIALINQFGTAFTVMIVPEGETPGLSNRVTQLAEVNNVRPDTVAFKFLDSAYSRGSTSFVAGNAYDIYVVPLVPFNAVAQAGSPIDTSEYSADLTDSSPSRFDVYFNNSDPTLVTSIAVGTTNGLVRAKLAALANRTLIAIIAGQENLYTVSAVNTSQSSYITLTVSNTEDGVSSISANDSVRLAVL